MIQLISQSLSILVVAGCLAVLGVALFFLRRGIGLRRAERMAVALTVYATVAHLLVSLSTDAYIYRDLDILRTLVVDARSVDVWMVARGVRSALILLALGSWLHALWFGLGQRRVGAVTG